MIILSLDLSLNRTGWAVMDTEKRQKKSRILDYGVINNKHLTSKYTGRKLYHIELYLKALLIAYNPDVIIVEELTGSAFTDTSQLAKVHGILEKLTMKFDNIFYINNKKFKAEFAGNGNAKKDEVEAKVLEYLPNLLFRYDDESDAVGFLIYYTMKEGICKW